MGERWGGTGFWRPCEGHDVEGAVLGPGLGRGCAALEEFLGQGFCGWGWGGRGGVETDFLEGVAVCCYEQEQDQGSGGDDAD